MEEPVPRKPGTVLSEEEFERYFRLQEMQLEFAQLFDYGVENDRAVAIVGPAFLDTLLTDMLVNFLVDDPKEVARVMEPDAPLGTFSAKVALAYCLGLIGETIKADLRLVGKIRNTFAHQLRGSRRGREEAHALSSVAGAPRFTAPARQLGRVLRNQRSRDGARRHEGPPVRRCPSQLRCPPGAGHGHESRLRENDHVQRQDFP